MGHISNDSKKSSFKKSTIFLLTVLITSGLSIFLFKTVNSSNYLEKPIKETVTKAEMKLSVKQTPDTDNFQYTDMTAKNWKFRMPHCIGHTKPDDPERTEIYLSVHAPKEIQAIVYEEIGINKFKKRKYIVPPLRFFERCFSSDNFRYNMDHENFASFFDFICVARYNAGEANEKSTESKVAYHQSVFIAIHETRTGNIVHELSTKLNTTYFPRNTSRGVINARLQKDLKKGLARIKFPELIDPELLEAKAKQSQ